jgi:uncharacterized damage-inducible protein DinB
MRKTDLDLLFSYNRWANARILAACGGISMDQMLTPAPVSFGSLMSTLVHILGTEVVWRVRLQQGISPDHMLQASEFRGLEVLASRWREEETTMQAFLSILIDSDMDRKVRFKRMNGAEEETTVWKALAHVILHGMQFRAEAGVTLTTLGRSPGDLDFIYYLREIGAR